jgi:hypothetical protein
MKKFRIVEVNLWDGKIVYKIQERVFLFFWLDLGYKHEDVAYFDTIGFAEGALMKHKYKKKKRIVRYL